MECECGGVPIEGKSSYSVSNEMFTFIIQDLPAYKCMRCSKVLFTEETVEKVKKLVRKIERETAEIITGRVSVNLRDYE